jgi:hypothetical protein
MIYLSYQNGSDPVVGKWQFELSCYEVPATTRVQSTTLRQVLVDHFVAVRRTWKIVISSDRPENDFAFLAEFWKADKRWLTDPVGSVTSIQVVAKEDGDFPLEYVDGLIMCPEVTLELQAKYAS